jgi:hypothetical protein
MSNLSLFFSINSKAFPQDEAAKAKAAFEKISNFSTDALKDVDPRITFDLSMTDLPQGPQSSKENEENLNSYNKGVSETHFFYFNTLFFSLLFLGVITLLQQMHESLPEAAKAEFASLVEGGNVFLAATMENGRVAFAYIGEAALVSFATIKEKVLEAAAEYSRAEL